MGNRIRWLPTPTQSHLLCLKIPPKNGSFMGSLMVHQVDISGYQRIWEPQFSDNHGNMSGFSAQLITITIFRQTHLRGFKKKNVSCGKYPHEIPWKSHHVCCLKISQSMFGTWIWSRHRQPLAEHRRPTRDLPPALGELQKAYTWVIINEICVGQLQKIMTCIITIRQL